MAEPLKNYFGPEIADGIAAMILAEDASFDSARFLDLASTGFEDLELTPRARHLSDALAETLPVDRVRAMEIITSSLGPEIDGSELTGMESFRYMPYVFFIADHGLDHFEAAMTAQYELTKRFTAEFSIRAYVERYPNDTLARLRVWASDANVHVRRLVSEGTRPRLPWAPRLRRFQVDPSPVIELLDLLFTDDEEYVRRSVANNLNDISKDHPDLAVVTARRWWDDDTDTQRLVRHGLRTLIKQGYPPALEILGYRADTPVRVVKLEIEPATVEIGESVRLTSELQNPGRNPAAVLVDFVVHFVKANGSTSTKVFKGAERTMGPGTTTVIGKTISVAQRSTRRHYPGSHLVEAQVNGVARASSQFVISGDGAD